MSSHGPHNGALQPMANPLRGRSAAELGRYSPFSESYPFRQEDQSQFPISRQYVYYDYLPGETQVKLAASLISPLPLYFETLG